MKRVVFAFVGFFACICGSAALADDCTLRQLAALKIDTVGGALVVPVTLDGKQVRFVLDPSHAFSLVLASYADAAGFERRPMPDRVHVGFSTGKVTGMEIVPSFAIGNASGKNLQVLRLENMAGSGDVVGVLGMDVLSNFDIELDVAHNAVNLFAHDHCEGKVVYWPNDGYAEIPYRTSPAGQPIFEMQLDGKPVTVAFTTEPGGSRMPMAAARRVFGIDEKSPGLIAINDSTPHAKQYHFPFEALNVEGIAVRNPTITLYGSSSDKECSADLHVAPGGDRIERCFGGFDLTLGVQELRALHLYMATKEKKLYVTAADAHAGEPKKITQ